MHVKYVCVFVYKCMYVGGYVHVCVWECVCVCPFLVSVNWLGLVNEHYDQTPSSTYLPSQSL